MTDTIRDLLISLASHMAYMQGQLEARHELDDPEDYYWYRESVLLRQKVAFALADEPAVPQPPAEGEVAELVAWLRERGQERETLHLPGAELSKQLCTAPFLLTRAADLLEQRHPAPVPVSERLQQMEDLAADAVAGLRYIELCHGRLYGVGWDLVYKKADRLKPAHALPISQ